MIYFCIFETSKHFSMRKAWCYETVIFYTLLMPLKNCARRYQMKRIGKIPHVAGQGGKNERWLICFNTFKSLSLSLTACLSRHDFDRTSLLHSLDMLRYDGLNGILGIKVVLLEHVTSTAVQSSCKPLTFMYCHHRMPKEADIFMYFSRLPIEAGLSILNFSSFVVGIMFGKELKEYARSLADEHVGLLKLLCKFNTSVFSGKHFPQNNFTHFWCEIL